MRVPSRSVLASFFLLLCIAPAAVLAQAATCPDIVKAALAAADKACATTGRNQACYGNINLTAQPQPGVTDFTFDKPGDLVSVAGVETLSLSPLDAAKDVWGVALMKIQANLPDTLPGQNVTFLLFGNVEIQNAVTTNAAPITVNVTANRKMNVRSGPSTTASVVGSLDGKQAVTADGRNEKGDWLRVQLDDKKTGWVSASLVKADGDLTTLQTLKGDEAPPPALNPMQAFYFKSGVGDSPCEGAPDSGILIQTPEGAGQVTLNANGVDIKLGSTAYLQAQKTEMEMAVVEGQGVVTSSGVTKIVPAGTKVGVPMTEQNGNLVASGPPGDPEPYDNKGVQALPVGLLGKKITIAPALTADQIKKLTSNIVPVPGTWTTTIGKVSSAGCPAEIAGAMGNMLPGITSTFEIAPGSASFIDAMKTTATAEGMAGMKISSPDQNSIVISMNQEGVGVQMEFKLVSPTEMQGKETVAMGDGCTLTIPFTMKAAGS